MTLHKDTRTCNTQSRIVVDKTIETHTYAYVREVVALQRSAEDGGVRVAEAVVADEAPAAAGQPQLGPAPRAGAAAGHTELV